MRNMLFLSHANPEDNEFSLWLALQLAKEGYPVWCDLTKLLGGENFWKDIESAIRDNTIKFIYVLSKTSNDKAGPRQELQVATATEKTHRLKDFIIPVLIDDLPHGEINIQLSVRNAVTFNKSWAAGLNALLKKLEQDKMPKNSNFTPAAVTTWWKTQFSVEAGVVSKEEEHLSNWFLIKALPKDLFLHRFKGTELSPLQFPYPAFRNGEYLVSFAKAEDFMQDESEHLIRIVESIPFSTEDFLVGKVGDAYIDKKSNKNSISFLLRLGWERMMMEKKLSVYILANKARAFYFKAGQLEKDRIQFINFNGAKTYRKVVGGKKDKSLQMVLKHYWHFGIQAKPLLQPFYAYIIKPHVVFSDNGKWAWDSKKRLHRARRSYCRNWWNPHWRDRSLAFLSWLSGETEEIQIEFGSDISIQISKWPLFFKSPVSYSDPGLSSSGDSSASIESAEFLEE